MTPIGKMIRAATDLYPIAHEGEEPNDGALLRVRTLIENTHRAQPTKALDRALAAVDDLRWAAPSRTAEAARRAREAIFAAAEELAK